jgi:hypothetical protein
MAVPRSSAKASFQRRAVARLTMQARRTMPRRPPQETGNPSATRRNTLAMVLALAALASLLARFKYSLAMFVPWVLCAIGGGYFLVHVIFAHAVASATRIVP